MPQSWIKSKSGLLPSIYCTAFRSDGPGSYPAFSASTSRGNALRTRLAQWPIFKTYIDWNQVLEDLKRDNKDN